MNLNNIVLIETIPDGNIYRADCSESILPGQYLVSEHQKLSIIKSERLHNHTQIIFQSKTEVQSQQEFTVSGSTINWSIDEKVTLFCEGWGNFIAVHWLNHQRKQLKSLINAVVMYETESFSFKPSPSQYMTPEYPSNMIASMPLLDDLGFSSRLACSQFQPGCFEGSLAELINDMPQKPEQWVGFVGQKTMNDISEVLGKPVEAYLIESI